MKTTAPKELGIVVIAALFGTIGGGVALVVYETGFVWALVVAGIVAVIVAIALWLGWREPVRRDLTPRPLGPRADADSRPEAHRAGTAGTPGRTAGPAAGTAGVTPGTAGASQVKIAEAHQTHPPATPGDARARIVADEAATATDTGETTSSDTGVPSSAEDPAGPDADHARSGGQRPDGDDRGMGGHVATTAAASANTGVVKSTADLPGQKDLADRKGEWKYTPPAKTDGAASTSAGRTSPPASSQVDATRDSGETVAAEPAPGADGTSEAEAVPDAGASVATTSGAAMATGAGARSVHGDASEDTDKPAMREAAREGGPDNLKEIKGVGPKLEVLLNEMGIYHFDQIAAWSERELAWIDENLVGFRGRASRDEWVAQAKVLADGGDTEFSKRVDTGDVY